MTWHYVGQGHLPGPKFHMKEVLVKIDHNCGYMVVLWDSINFRFLPLSFYDQDISTNLITGVSHWCEITV